MLAFGGLLPVAVLASLQSPYGGWLHAVWLGGVNRFYTTFGAIAFVFLWRAVLLWILKGWIASVSLDLARSISAWWIERLGRAGAWACLFVAVGTIARAPAMGYARPWWRPPAISAADDTGIAATLLGSAIVLTAGITVIILVARLLPALRRLEKCD